MTTIRSNSTKVSTPTLPVSSPALRSTRPPSTVAPRAANAGDRFERPQRPLVNLASNSLQSPPGPSGPNAERAEKTRESVAAIARGSPQAGARLVPEINGILVQGVANPRTTAANGQEGILGQRQADSAARTLANMPQAGFEQIQSLLRQAGQGPGGQVLPGADPAAEQALILKAVAARSMTVGNPDAGGPGYVQAMKEIQDFATEVRGMDRAELMRTTSVIDLDETVNSSQVDPNAPLASGDPLGNNDGLFQRFQDSCTPTSSQIIRAEADPAYALELHSGGLDNLSVLAPVAQEQAQVLEKERFFRPSGEVTLTDDQLAAYRETGALPAGVTAAAGSARTRLGSDARIQLNSALSAAESAKVITPEQGSAIRKYMSAGELSDVEKTQMEAGLAVLEGSGPFTNRDQLEAVRWDATRPSRSAMRYQHALGDIASPVTHTPYAGQMLGSNGMRPNALQRVEEMLKSGADVPFAVISEGAGSGHAMVFTDVRGSGNDRSFLVADPWSGRTDWVSEQDLSDPNSGFLKRQFDMDWTTVYQIFMPSVD